MIATIVAARSTVERPVALLTYCIPAEADHHPGEDHRHHQLRQPLERGLEWIEVAADCQAATARKAAAIR